jgi:hypothetical protein
MNAGTNGKDESSRSILAFNLSGIPTNAIVTSVALTVKVVQLAPEFPAPVNMDLRRLLVDWDEDAATWSNRLTSIHWSTNGAAAPLDFSSSISQKIIVNDLGTYTFVSNSNLVADVQSSVANPGSNFGWIIISEAQGMSRSECKFGTRDDPPNGASLTVQFIVPATPPALSALSIFNGQFHFRFNAESNRNYAVEYRGSLPGTNWSVLTNFPPLPVNTNILVSDPLTSSNRFYRARTP